MGLNHVYKVIWSKTKGCYVVVSEMAKRVGRNKAKAIVMSTAAMAMAVTPALMNVDRVEAEVLIGKTDGTTISANGSTVNSWGITIGGGITNAGSHSVHVGDATLEEGERNVIIGTHATAGVDNGVRRFVRQSTAIGGGASANEGARAFGDQSIAIGANTIAEGNSSIAIGNDDVDRAVDKQIKYTNPDGVEETNNLGNAYNKLTGKNLLSDGGQYADTRSGEAAIAIGVKAEAGDISLALGTGAKAKKVNTVSIGTGATADLDNSVAIGGGAVADKSSQGTKQTSTTINGITYEWAGGDKTNEGDIVSFGKPGFERQLKNIAAGEISSTSTDAINGSQIHSLVEKITGTPKLSYTTKDGTPVYKLGDKFYKVNEQGQPISEAGKPAVGTNQDGKLVDADNNVIEPINPATTPLKNALVNSNPAAGKTGTTSPTALNNITSNLVNFDAPNVNGKVPAKNALRNLVNDAVSDDTVATVGDLRNMGWIVSADKTTGADGTATDAAYSETVKNANEVKFVGKDGAIVSGTTDAATGVRTITVGLDKKAMSGAGDSGSPVAYTKADGTKVYPVKAENGSVTYHTTPNGEGPNDAVVLGTEVITSVNGPDGTTTPATLTNVAGNLVGAKKDTNAPTTEQAAPTLGTAAGQVNVHNAATVGDVLNAGWNLQNNDAAKDFVKAYDTVNFINGDGTTAVVETTDNKVSTIKYNVNTGNGLEKDTATNKIQVKPGDKSLDVTEAGVTVKKADQSLEVTDAGLKVKTDGTTITAGDNGLTINTGTVNAVESGDKKGTVEVPTADAGKIATVDTVAKAVNSASFTLKATATTDGIRNTGSAVDENGEQIKAGSTVELVAGKNLDVKHDTNGKITFATKDEVAFNTVQIGGSEGPKLTKTDSGDLKLSDKDGTKPVAITNVKSNLPETKNGAPAEATKAQPVPTLGTEADQVNANNAATVGDVLNAGWNVQENGTAKDFVKAYDTVNFVNGGNTTAVVTTNAEGTVSNVSFNVTGLPVSYTTEDGKPVSKVGDKFYKVNEHGQPVSEAGKAAVGTNAEGKLVDADNNVIEPIDTTAAPLKTALVNPTPAADKTGTTSPTALNNVTSGLHKYGDQVDGKPVEGTTPANTGLIDLSTPADGAAPKVSDNTAATVGDLRNMGWIVSADKTTGDLDKAYSATVKNANEVKFVGTGTAIVSGETKDGVRTITVNVDDQVSANNAKTPVAYTKADGTKVYPIKGENGVITYHTTPDGKGDNDQEVPGTEVITSVNSPDGTTTPATLANVAGNLDGAKKDTTAPKAEAAAPNTTNKDGDKYINPNNAATVGDVLQAGWNVQENGTAKDFVKPYDKVNFVNGGNTTAVVTTNAEGTVSNVSFNVTGLPVSYTTEDGKPVSKVGDKFYKVNEQGQPISEAGKPAVGTNAEGKLVDADNNVIEPIDPAATPLKTALVNPTPAADKTGTTSPTQLTNVEGNLEGAKTGTNAPTTAATAPNTTDATQPNYVNTHNAATVGDVLQAGWNLQNNGEAKDFVKPFDKVNFVNGGNTTAVVTTNAEGTVSNVSFNVTGLPVSYTTEDGKPVSKVGDKFYKVNEQGQPISEAGKPAVGTNAEGKLVDADNNVIEPIDTTAAPLKTALVNPTPAADKTGTTSPTALNNVTSGLHKYGDQVDGKPVEGTTPANTGLIDLSTPADGAAPKVSDNTAATVGDLRNMGWIVSSNKTTGDLEHAYSATVKNANEVKFVGTGTAIVSGETKDGVRTITVNVDDQVSANNAKTPVAYTKADGTKVYPIKGENGVITYHTTPDGKGDNDQEVPGTEVITSVNSPDGTTTPATLANVAGNLEGAKKDTITPKTEAAAPNTTNKDGDKYINPNNAATVGDVLNAGWNVQENGTAKDFVKPYDTVNFVNGGNTTAVVTTNAEGTVSNVSFNVTGLPVSYTTEDGKPVSKVGDKFYKVNENGQPVSEAGKPAVGTNAEGKLVDADNNVIEPIDPAATPLKTALVNAKPEADKTGTTSPTQLTNVEGNLDGAKTGTNAPITEATAPNTTDAAQPNYVNTHNAATVGDVLQAGWNLQNNGEAKDFVKPFDKVNFVNGGNTTAVVTTNAEGTVNNVSFNVTGLPVSYTTEDGKPVSKVGDKFYKVNEQGQPVSEAGKPAVGTNAEGKLVDADNNIIEAIDTTATPLKTALVNPTPAADKTGTTSPTALNNVTSGLHKYGDQVDGKPVEGTTPANTGLIDLSTPADGAAPKVSDNTAATVGDLRNMGWIVSSNKTTGDLENAYSATVKNANEVKFVGTGTAIVSGKTDENGVRTITVNVDDQVSANNAQTPVVYTDKEGKQVYPIKDEQGNITYHTTPNGKGEGDKTVPNDEVNTSVNGPKDPTTGEVRPASLSNVKNNLPAVNDGDKKVTNADGTEKENPGDVGNINKAPLTAAEAADLLNPTKDGQPNPKYVGNNAATVSDVLNAGWNLQENGTAKDFVKPYDTVNFINGANTTAVVTTSEDGTTSKVTYNVTGLPVSYTTEDGKPVSKVGDKFYKVNEKGQPLAEDGTPAAGTDKDGNPITANGTVIKAIDPTVDPLKTALVNPNPEAGKTGTTAPTQLTNVANGADTFKPANDVKQANDGKWYNASDVEPNGKVKDGAKSVASPVATKNAAGDVLEKGKDGNWYKASDLENGEPKPNVDAQTPVAKPENAEKAGLVNFEGSNPNNAATVGDLQNLGFIVSAADNGYTEQMRNANKVEFKGSNGVSVTGKTLEDGTREITVALKEGRVTNNVIITKADGTEVHGERGEDGKYYQYEKDPVSGQPKKVEVPVVPGDTVTNDGDAYVTGNSVATAIQKSGWNIGIGSTDKAFSEEEKTYEHVNPNDHVKYVNGDNTTVSMAVDPEKDRDGTTVTTTYVKVDVKRDLKIDSLTTGGPAKDTDGNSLQEINGEYYPANAVEKDGKVYPAGTVFIDGKAYPAGSAKDPNTNGVVKDGQPATEVQPLTATPKDKVADGKDGAMTVKDAKGKDGVSATAKDGKGVLTLNNAGTDKDGKDASTVNISTAKAPTDLGNTPKDGSEAPTMDRIQYTDGTGTSHNVATMNDGLRFVGDDDKAIDKTLNSTLTLTGGNREATNKPVAEEATTTGNIGVFNKDGKLSIQLAKDLDKLNSANFESKTDKAGNPLTMVDGKYYSPSDLENGKPKADAKPVDAKDVQAGSTSQLTGAGLNFNTPAPKDENGNPLVLVDGKYYKADNLENGKPKAGAKPEAVKPAQSTAITPDGLAITPDTAKVVDPKTGEVTVDPTKVVSFGGPSIVTDPATGKAVIDPKTGEPVMKSGISAGGQVMSNVASGVLDTDAVNVSQLKGVAHNINMRMNRMGAQAAAMASLQSIQYDPLEPTQISAGVGHYKGASALAVGVNHFKNESTMFHMGASLNGHGDESMINASVTWKFGGRADETAVKDTFRQGPISTSYTLQDKVSALEEQNQVLKEQVAELFRRLNEKA